MAVEDLLEEIGSFGRYQKTICFVLINLGTALCALTFYTQIFILESPKHICKANSILSDGFEGHKVKNITESVSISVYQTGASKDNFDAKKSINKFLNHSNILQYYCNE